MYINILHIKENSDILNLEEDIYVIKSIPELYYWKDDNFKLLGFNKEKNDNENKYELPPPIDNNLYFGELFICKIDDNNNFVDTNIEEFQAFYNKQFGGFYDIEFSSNEEEDELSEHTSDNDFINDDTLSEYSINSEISLDFDNDTDVSDVSIDITSDEEEDNNNELDNNILNTDDDDEEEEKEKSN